MQNTTEQQSKNKVEVLNISNTNGLGEVVLNDEKLLELIQNFPFLYYARVRPYQDPDFAEWAWSNIATSFNRTYQNMNPPVKFTPEELQKRWEILRPIVINLSKVTSTTAVPERLRQFVVKISIQLEEPRPRTYPYSRTFKLINEQIDMVNQLKDADRKRMEAEMMDLLLQSELDLKATVRLTAETQQRAEQEYEDFLKAMEMKELFVISNDLEESNPYTPAPVQAKAAAQDIPEPDLLKPIPNKKWIPLSMAPYYVRPCAVRVKRCCLDDYIPLASIKRERRW